MKINELTENTSCTLDVLIKEASRRVAKNNSEYFDLLVGDTTGSIKCKVWGVSKSVNFEVGSVYQITGMVKKFNDALQIEISSYKESNLEAFDLCQRSKYSIDSMLEKFYRLVESIQDEKVKQLLNSVFDEETLKKFKVHGGSATVHHAFVGGLLQHTLLVASSAKRLCEVYKKADSDVVVAAALLHDVGKLEELSAFPENKYTCKAVAIGHVVMGVVKVSKCIDSIEGFPEDKAVKIMNCLTAHHGQLEWGAPVVPCCMEAYIVHASDMLDAKIELILESTENLHSGELSEKNFFAHTSFIAP